jgi:hypothetical protein
MLVTIFASNGKRLKAAWNQAFEAGCAPQFVRKGALETAICQHMLPAGSAF